MSFLTEDQRSIQQLAHDFAQSAVKNKARAAEADPAEMMQLWRQLADMGLAGLAFPETYGGAGADYLSYCCLIEELARVSASLAVMLSVHTTVGILPIFDFGNDAQKTASCPIC
ncbi:MAG: acyl-CoA dehydrogenase family protein [Vampirovibrionales bacterium]